MCISVYIMLYLIIYICIGLVFVSGSGCFVVVGVRGFNGFFGCFSSWMVSCASRRACFAFILPVLGIKQTWRILKQNAAKNEAVL